MILYSVERFLGDSDCGEIIVVHASADTSKMADLLKRHPSVKLIPGGETRQQSVLSGLKAVQNPFVFIHDGARPNLKKSYLESLKKSLMEHDAAALAIPVRDTTVDVDHDIISAHYDRKRTYSIQTPQAFRTEEIIKAHLLATHSGAEYPDDTSVYSATFPNKDVKIVPGDDENIKVTTKTDLMLMEGLL